MRYAAIHRQRDHWPVRFQCRVLNVSVSGFYDWLNREPSPRQQRRAVLGERIAEIHAEHWHAYGSPRVHEQLKQEGEAVSEKTVASIMQARGIAGKYRTKRVPRTTQSEHDRPVAPNHLERDFTADAPNRKWTADITDLGTEEGWCYLAVILDVFSRRVVGWSLADHLRGELVEDALRKALLHRSPAEHGLIHHSDRGVQYASRGFQQLLDAHGIVCSMSRKGDCYDNAVMESFIGTLKTEMDEPLASRVEARRLLFEFIEVFYNRKRLHSTLGYTSPAAYERQHQAA
jgi:transposase InsO family protein